MPPRYGGVGPLTGKGCQWAALFMKLDLSGTSILQNYASKGVCCVCGENKSSNHHDLEMEEFRGLVCRECLAPLAIADTMLNRIIPGFNRPKP